MLLFDLGDFFPCFIEKIPKFGFAEKWIWILTDVKTVLREDFLPNLIFIIFYRVAIRFLIWPKLIDWNAWNFIDFFCNLNLFLIFQTLLIFNPFLLYVMLLEFLGQAEGLI